MHMNSIYIILWKIVVCYNVYDIKISHITYIEVMGNNILSVEVRKLSLIEF